MNNMTTEEKARRYDEAIEKARIWKNKSGMPKDRQGILDDIFPELAESEDERIRKWIRKELESKYVVDNIVNNVMADKALAWLEKQKTSDKALQYLKENHSPSEVSDFQAAMNIAIAKAYDKGYNDGLKNQGEQKPAWSEEDEKRLQSCVNILQAKGLMGVTETINTKWLKSLKDRVQLQSQWKPSDEQMEYLLTIKTLSPSPLLESLYIDLEKLREK